jgi:hypothetical protein
MHCYNCGQKQLQKGNFCTSCGVSLAVEDMPKEKPAGIESKKEPLFIKEKVKKCFCWLKKKIAVLVGICLPHVIKHKKKIAIGIVVALALFIVFSFCRDYLRARNIEKGEKHYVELVEKIKNDTKGGKTPEETIQLYLKALEEKNIDEAVQYYTVDKQEFLLGELSALLKDVERYEKWTSGVKMAKKINEEKNIAIFEYDVVETEETKLEGTEIVFPPGTYKATITLKKIQSGVWKLEN